MNDLEKHLKTKTYSILVDVSQHNIGCIEAVDKIFEIYEGC